MERVTPSDIQLTLVDSQEAVEAFYAWEPESAFVACDIETTGLQRFGPKADKIRLVQFGDENHGWSIPYDRWMVHHGPIMYAIRKFSGRLVGHNSTIFDEPFIQNAGHLTGPQSDDTYIAHHLLYPLDYHGLKPAAGKLYGREVRAGEKWLDKVKQQNRWDWATVPIDHPAYWGYAAMDTVLTARLATDLVPVARLKFGPQYARELRVGRMMAEMAERGLHIDLTYAEQLMERWAYELDALTETLRSFSIDKPGSPAQIVRALMEQDWEPDVMTDGGQPSVNRAVLEGLDNEIARSVLRWRRLRKWSVAYVQPMLDSGGILYPDVQSLRASTGRMAVSNPPLQQLPRGPEVRRCVLTDPDTDLYAVDFTGQEARLIAAFAQDPRLTHDILYGGDVHGNIARELHGLDYTKDQRSWSKNGFYAYAYGAQSKRLAITTHTKQGRAEKAIAAAYPGLVAFNKNVMRVAKERQERDGMAWAKTLGGRIVAVPKSQHYALSNYIMQGSGADMMKMALEQIDDAGLDGTIKLVVHDEVLASLPKGKQGKEQAATIAECMRTEFRGIPFDAEPVGPGDNWGEVVH